MFCHSESKLAKENSEKQSFENLAGLFCKIIFIYLEEAGTPSSRAAQRCKTLKRLVYFRTSG
jgi:hypothetical protein